MDKYISRGKLISGAPLERTKEVSIASMSRAVRIRDLPLPFSEVRDLYLTSTSGTLDTLVFPLFWDLTHATSLLSLTLDRDDGTTSVVSILVDNPSSASVIAEINAHAMLSAINEQGYIRISAFEQDVWRIRVNDVFAAAGQAAMSHIQYGVFKHVYVEVAGSTPDPRSYGERDAVKSSPSRVETATTNVSSYIQRHEDRTSSGLNRAVDSVATNVESLRDGLGSIRVRHEKKRIADAYQSNPGETPIRWHREGDSVVAVVIDGSMLPVLLPTTSFDASDIYALIGDDSFGLLRSSKSVDLLDIYGTPADVLGQEASFTKVSVARNSLAEGSPLNDLPDQDPRKLINPVWSIVDEVTLNIEGAEIGLITRGDIVRISAPESNYVFEVDSIPRNGRVVVRSAVGSPLAPFNSSIYTRQVIPKDLQGNLIVERGPSVSTTEFVYVHLRRSIRIEDIADVGGAYISVPVVLASMDYSSSDKLEDRIIDFGFNVGDFLLRLQGPLYRTLSAHEDFNLQGLVTRQGLGRSIFELNGSLLVSPNYDEVPPAEELHKILTSVATSNYGAPVTFKKNSTFRYAPIRPMSQLQLQYCDIHLQREEGLKIQSCVYSTYTKNLSLIGDSKGEFNLRDQGRVVSLRPKIGGVFEFSSARCFSIVEVINRSRVVLQPIIGEGALVPSVYPSLSDNVECECYFISPTIADELTDYASVLHISSSLTIEPKVTPISKFDDVIHKGGYAGKSSIEIRGGGDTSGGDLVLESIHHPNINLANVMVAARFREGVVTILLGGTEHLDLQTEAMLTLNNHLRDSLFSGLVLAGSLNNIESAAPSSALSGQLLKLLSPVVISSGSRAVEELIDQEEYELAYSSGKTSVYGEPGDTLYVSLEFGAKVTAKSTLTPTYDDRLRDILNGLYKVSRVHILSTGAVAIDLTSRLRVSASRPVVEDGLILGASNTDLSRGTYILGIGSFYRAVEETKSTKYYTQLATRSIFGAKSKGALSLEVNEGADSKGLVIAQGLDSKGIQVTDRYTGVGIEVNRGDAEDYVDVGARTLPNSLAEYRHRLTSPSIDSEKLIFNPYVVTASAIATSDLLSKGGPDLTGNVELIDPNSPYLSTSVTQGRKKSIEIANRSLSPALRAVNLIPNDLSLIVGPASLYYKVAQSLVYREPSALIGTKRESDTDPNMYGALSVFTPIDNVEDLSPSAWKNNKAAIQSRGDLVIDFARFLIIPEVLNESYESGLSYTDFNRPHVGYVGYDTFSGVGSHLVPIGDAGLLPVFDTATTNYSRNTDLRFGLRKVLEPDYSAFAVFPPANIVNDSRRLYDSATFSQSAGKYSGNRIVGGKIEVAGAGLSWNKELTSINHILGEPRKVSRWSITNSEVTLSDINNGTEGIQAEYPNENYVVPSDKGRACRVILTITRAAEVLGIGDNNSLGNLIGSNSSSSWTQVKNLLTLSGVYFSDSLGGVAHVGYIGNSLIVRFTAVVKDVKATYLDLYSPDLSEVLAFPAGEGSSDTVWSKLSLVSNNRLQVELFGKRWDLNASMIATDAISVTDTGAVSRPWPIGDPYMWQNISGELVDWIAHDELVRITATEHGSFFRNDVYFMGDLIAKDGEVYIDSLNVDTLSSSHISALDAGRITTGATSGIRLYDETNIRSVWEATSYIWGTFTSKPYELSDHVSSVNSHQNNSQYLPLRALPNNGNIVRGAKGIGIEVDNSISAQLFMSNAYVNDLSSGDPVVHVHRRDTGMQSDLYLEGDLIPGNLDDVPSSQAYRSGVTSLYSSVLFDLSNEDSELHICSHTPIPITRGTEEIYRGTFNSYEVQGGAPVLKNLIVRYSCGSDIRDGTAYNHYIDLTNASLPQDRLSSPKIYKYKYLFFVVITDASTHVAETAYVLQANPVKHQLNRPHVRAVDMQRYLASNGFRGNPVQFTSNYAVTQWSSVTDLSNLGLTVTSNLVPDPDDLYEEIYEEEAVDVASYAYFNDFLPSNLNRSPGVPGFGFNLFSSKWATLADSQYGAETNNYFQEMWGGFLGFIGEYNVPLNNAERLLRMPSNNTFFYTSKTLLPALREAFSAIAELTPTKFAVKLPIPSAKWLGREFKVSIPTYSSHTSCNPFLGVWSEARKVGSMSDYFYYTYRGIWSEPDSDYEHHTFWQGSAQEAGGNNDYILKSMLNIKSTKDRYAGHLSPHITPNGLVGNSITAPFPSIANHNGVGFNSDGLPYYVLGKYEESSWTTVYGPFFYELETPVIHIKDRVSESEDIVTFSPLGTPTYTFEEYLSVESALYPGMGNEFTSQNYNPETMLTLSAEAESCDILVYCDAKFIDGNFVSRGRYNDIVDTIRVTPDMKACTLTYTCVPISSENLEIPLTDTASATEEILYRWVKL